MDYVNPFENYNVEKKKYLLKGDEVRYIKGADAQMRLANGMVMFRGLPVYLNDTMDESRILATTWDSVYTEAICFNDERIDITSPQLGWVNTEGLGPIFVKRAPHRQQQQSLNVKALDFNLPFSKDKAGGAIFSTLGLSIKAVGDTMLGVYPSLDECLKRPRGGAFSREWAVAREKNGRGIVLLHNQFPVGYLEGDQFLFIPGELTKTRLRSLTEEIKKNGGGYAIKEIVT
jgi:hypothetical protein